MNDLFHETRFYAEFSEYRLYRYVWASLPLEELKRPLLCCGLNPSKANADQTDPTVVRMLKRAEALECDGLIMWNAYALVSTDPIGLYNTANDFDPIGPANDQRLLELAPKAKLVVCAWGAHINKVRLGRSGDIYRILRGLNIQPLAFAINRDGSPTHPLYLPYDLKPEPIT